MKTIKELAAFLKCPVNSLEGCGSDAPCYVLHHYIDPDWKVNKTAIRAYIRIARGRGKRGVISFSVTEKEKNWEMWLSVFRTYPSATIIQTQSRYHGDYRCWLVFFQHNGK